jgi:two-component system, OmpR family, sensor histidine kinase QseC
VSDAKAIDRLPDIGTITARWILAAGLLGFSVQLGFTLHENLFDERYYTQRFIMSEAERLIAAATSSDGRFEGISESALQPYYGKHAAAYGYRIIDAKAQVLMQSNGADLERLSPLTDNLRMLPDFWQRKTDARWFEVAGGIKHRTGQHDVWVEVMTHGDPAFYRFNALLSEIMLDVCAPLAPTLLLTLLCAIVGVRQALRPLTLAADRARVIDVRQGPIAFGMKRLPREAAIFTRAINRLIGRVGWLLTEQKKIAAQVAHELRSRLAIVLLELNKIADPRARILEADVAEMSSALNRILAIWSLEASGDVRRNAQLIQLGDVADKVVSRLLPLAEKHSCKLSRIVDTPEPFLGSEAAVLEAVQNVVENAIKHCPDGTEVRITCGPGSAISIEDSGPGLNVDCAERLFQPFQRGKTRADGSGLGLAIVKLAVDLHRGSIRVGRSPLGGAEFVLRFVSIEAGDRQPDIVALRTEQANSDAAEHDVIDTQPENVRPRHRMPWE